MDMVMDMKDEKLMAYLDEQNEAAWQIRRRERAKSLEMAIEVNKKATEIAYEKGRVLSEVTLAVHNIYQAEYESALDKLLGIESIINDMNLPIWHVRTLNTFSFAYINMGKHDRALPYLNQGLAEARAHQINDMAVFLLYNLAEIYKGDGIKRYEDAFVLLEEARALSEVYLKDSLPLMLASMAVCQSYLGNKQLMMTYVEAALTSASESSEMNSIDQCYHILGELYFKEGDYPKCLEIVNKSMAHQKQYSQAYGLANNDYLLARAYHGMGQDDLAYSHASHAMAVASELGMSIKGGLAQLLGTLSEANGEFESTVKYMKIVLEENEKQYTMELKNQISVMSAELKNTQLQKDAEIYRLKNIALKEKSDALEVLLKELKETQNQLILQEKMASLGNLISGIAHEINTPFGVIQAAVQNVQKYASQVISVDFPELLLRLDQVTRESLVAMLQQASKNHVLLTTSQERQKRVEIQAVLLNEGDSEAFRHAEQLVDMRLFEITQPVLSVIRSPHCEAILETVYQLSGIIRNLEHIQISVSKASKTIFALKNYAHFSASEEFVSANPIDGIDTILQLYHNQMKNHVILNLEIEDVGLIDCLPDELHQVWMNLVQNALQAMNYSGKLTIRSKRLEKTVLISIEDTGDGIAAENSERVFEPFFTTKKMGVGSGLGLHLVSNIVKKHHGTITFDSQPGLTTFNVMLPITQNS